jgi:hypothetical protein
MRRMTQAPSDPRQRGVSAVIIALSAVAIFGIAAFVIDVAALYAERRELQNGADAAALAVAADCALGDCGDARATADQYVDANAHDGDANVWPDDITFPAPNTVRVRATTADADGDLDGDPTTVDFIFGRIFDRDGQTISATAAATWGSPAGASTLPIIFSLCEWEAVSASSSFVELPLDGSEGPPVVIRFHQDTPGQGQGQGQGADNGGGTTVPDDCVGQAGQDVDGDGRLPGGFGWLQQDGCRADINIDNWVGAKPGSGPPNGCDPSQLLDRVLLIPVFDDTVDQNDPDFAGQCSTGPGGKCYHVHGFAAFYVTGFRFPGVGSGWVQNPPCSPPDSCIGGYFTDYVFELPGTDTGGPDLGAVVVELVE